MCGCRLGRFFRGLYFLKKNLGRGGYVSYRCIMRVGFLFVECVIYIYVYIIFFGGCVFFFGGEWVRRCVEGVLEDFCVFSFPTPKEDRICEESQSLWIGSKNSRDGMGWDGMEVCCFL